MDCWVLNSLKGRYNIGNIGKTASMSMLILFESRYTFKGRYNIGNVGKTVSPFALKFSWKKRSIHQGKKEVACIVSKPLVSCLWGCVEPVNPPNLNIQEVQGALSSRPKGDPGPLPIFSREGTVQHW